MSRGTAEPAGVSRGHSTLGVVNSRGRPEHQVRGETDAFARRAKTAEN
ncbi:retron-type reverse transcriptase, partial [Calderihabitans maritimus]